MSFVPNSVNQRFPCASRTRSKGVLPCFKFHWCQLASNGSYSPSASLVGCVNQTRPSLSTTIKSGLVYPPGSLKFAIKLPSDSAYWPRTPCEVEGHLGFGTHPGSATQTNPCT